MITAKHKQDLFMREFKELLERHNADFEITENGGDWGDHIEGIVEITIPAKYDDDYNLLEEYTNFTIRNYDI